MTVIHPRSTWPFAGVGLEASPLGVRTHGDLLSDMFRPVQARATDALIAETRRHLEGCLNGIETALRLRLAADAEHGPRLAEPLAALEDGGSWAALEHVPDMIGPALLDHMRQRAAVALLSRSAFRPLAAPGGSRVAAADLTQDEDPVVAQAASELVQAQGRWVERPGGLLRADLPAEYYAELSWIAGAMMAERLRVSGALSPVALHAAIAVAVRHLQVHHDEGQGPFAAAAILTLLIGDRDGEAAFALHHRHYLLFAALTAHRVGCDIGRVLACLLDAPLPVVTALAAAMGADKADQVALAGDLRAVRRDLGDDFALVQALEDNGAVDPLAELAVAPELADRILRLRGLRQ